MTDTVEKSFGLPENIDPDHVFIYRSGEYGIYEYWYQDQMGNYWRYTNAPKDHPQFDPFGGEALMDPNQPMPHTAPQFYAQDGRKRNVAVPPAANVQQNMNYDAASPRNIWFETFLGSDGVPRYTYLDKDIRENLDLWVQQQLRVTDAGISSYRKYAAKLFESDHPKDHTFSVILMLSDQGYYDPYELIQATTDDLEFVGDTVILLGRKFVCDPPLQEYLTGLKAKNDPASPLFVLDTIYGKQPIGKRHVYSIFAALKVSPHFILYWHANHLFSKIVHRMHGENVPSEEVEELALNELSRLLSTTSDVRYLLDVKLKNTLMDNYASLPDEGAGSEEPPKEADTPEEAAAGGAAPADAPPEESVAKSLVRVSGDDLGIAVVHSDFDDRDELELAFSQWLHAEPMHEITPEEESVIEQKLGEAAPAQDAQADQNEKPAEGDEGAVLGGDKESDTSDEGAVKQSEESPKPDAAGSQGVAGAPAKEKLPSGGKVNG